MHLERIMFLFSTYVWRGLYDAYFHNTCKAMNIQAINLISCSDSRAFQHYGYGELEFSRQLFHNRVVETEVIV